MRLSKEQALELIRHGDLKELGRMATARKKELWRVCEAIYWLRLLKNLFCRRWGKNALDCIRRSKYQTQSLRRLWRSIFGVMMLRVGRR